MKQPDNKVYKTVVIVWLTLSVASVVLATVAWIQLANILAESREAVAIQSGLDDVKGLLVDAQNSQRGFAISGKQEFLEPFTAAEASLPAAFDRLVELTGPHPAMQEKVVALRALAEQALGFHRRVIATRREQGLQAAVDLVSTAEGDALMKRVRSELAEIRGTRAGLVRVGGTGAGSHLLRAILTSLVAGVLGIGAGVFAFRLSRLTLNQQERERDLVEAKLQAERRSREKTTFLANMSHEIRTPMNAILGFTELLDQDLQEPKQRQYLHSIRTSASSLLQLITDILDMSKIEAGVLELRLEPTDPREICYFLKTVFTEPAVRKGLKLECHIADDLPRALLLDRIRLRQILVNLVGNALKFTERGSIRIQVSSEPQESKQLLTLILEVRDTGVGIPEGKLDAIFQPFIQAGFHHEKEKAGTGLGLAIVRRLAEMMGGTVTATSALGEGSTFRLSIPNVVVSELVPLNETREPGREVDFNELRAATFLIVDDNVMNCELVEGMFAHSHHRLVFGVNGLEAVQKAREIVPDIILLDVRMPVMGGREALVEIRKLPGLERTPVIAVTASSLMNQERDEAERFNGYVRKPFSKRELFDEIAHFLPRQASTTQPAGPAAGAGSPQSPVLSGLITSLRQVLVEDWPAVRDSLAINETRAFAANLEALAQKWNCDALAAYAQSLGRHAQNYAVMELEHELQRFPDLVEMLEQNTRA